MLEQLKEFKDNLDKEQQEQLQTIINDIENSDQNAIQQGSEARLVYKGKKPKYQILNNTQSTPYIVKDSYRKGEPWKHEGLEYNWSNKIIFGDNLGVLQRLIEMKNEGLLINPDGSHGVKLCYIDPPFATKSDFGNKSGEKAYKDKLAGSEFLEFLRERLILIHELLSDTGTLYLHLDYRTAPQAKMLLDEIFGVENFGNEIIWTYSGPYAGKKHFPRKHDTIYRYGKTSNMAFYDKSIRVPYQGSYDKFTSADSAFNQEKKDNRSRYEMGKVPEDYWNIAITARMRVDGVYRTGYPTEKPYKLLDRIINGSSQEGDIVLDCFMGSGTTLRSAEKLNRRWIGVDAGRLGVATTKKSLLEMPSRVLKKEKLELEIQPFDSCEAGLYTFDDITDDDWFKFLRELYKVDNNMLSDKTHCVFVGLNDLLTSEYIEAEAKILKKKHKKIAFISAERSLSLYSSKLPKGVELWTVPPEVFTGFVDDLHQSNILDGETSLNAGSAVIQSSAMRMMVAPEVGFETNVVDGVPVLKVVSCQVRNSSSIKLLESECVSGLSFVLVDYDFDGSFDFEETFAVSKPKKHEGDFIVEHSMDVQCLSSDTQLTMVDVAGNELRVILKPEVWK